MQNAACFYNCEPVIDYFGVGDSTLIYRVPICASYCNDWFNACRNDNTCVVNWLLLINVYIETGCNSCPPKFRCRTFEEAYTNGAGLCNTMWGTSYMYSEDENNCTVMDFPGDMPNPNLRLSFPFEGAAIKEASSLTTIATITIGLIFFNFM